MTLEIIPIYPEDTRLFHESWRQLDVTIVCPLHRHIPCRKVNPRFRTQIHSYFPTPRDLEIPSAITLWGLFRHALLSLSCYLLHWTDKISSHKARDSRGSSFCPANSTRVPWCYTRCYTELNEGRWESTPWESFSLSVNQLHAYLTQFLGS